MGQRLPTMTSHDSSRTRAEATGAKEDLNADRAPHT
jgi:hypothetical protein